MFNIRKSLLCKSLPLFILGYAVLVLSTCSQSLIESRIVQLVEPPTIPVTYSVNVDTVEGGSVTIYPSEARYAKNEILRLTAFPADGWHFVRWDGTENSEKNPFLITLADNEWIIPVFERDSAPPEIITYTIRVDVANSGGVLIDPDNQKFLSGELVCIKALPVENHTFTGWTGTVNSESNPLVLEVKKNEWIIPTFKELSPIPPEVTYSLKVEQQPGGVVACTPNKNRYGVNEQVLIQVSVNEGYIFKGWTGTLAGTENPKILSMNGNEWLIPVFVPLAAPESFKINCDTGIGGIVTVSPQKDTYRAGEQVKIQAVPNTGYLFTGWNGTETGIENPKIVTINGDEWILPSFTARDVPTVYTIKLETSDNGSVSLVPLKQDYNFGELVRIQAIANNGYTFTGWSGTESGNENPKILTVSGNEWIVPVFTANAAAISYEVNVDSIAGGSVVKSPNKTTYSAGEQVRIQATANNGYTFTGWSGTESGNENPKILTVSGNEWIIPVFTANAAPVTHTVTISSVVGGSVTVNPSGKTNFNTGEQIQLTAVPLAGYTFTGWSGTESGNENPKVLTMNANEWIVPVFTQIPTYSLTIGTPAGGSVTTNLVNNRKFLPGEQIILTATSLETHIFTGWSGTESGTENPKVITMNRDELVIPIFTPKVSQNTYKLTLGSAAGGGIESSAGIKEVFTAGEQVLLTAKPNSGYIFTGWSGTESGSENPKVLTMNANEWVVPVFALQVDPPAPTDYFVRVDDSPNGSIDIDPAKQKYLGGEYVKVKATPNEGFVFTGWDGTLISTQNPLILRVNDNVWITPQFRPEATYQVITNLKPVGGSILVEPNKTSGYKIGEQCLLTAVPEQGYQFDGWSGDITSKQTKLYLSFDKNYRIDANFSVIPVVKTYSLAVDPCTNGSITVSPHKTQYYENEIVRITAMPDAEYMLSNWGGDLSLSADNLTGDIVMTSDKRISATFCEREWTHLIYMAADNNLDSQAINDLNEIESAVFTDKKMNVIVLVDRKSGNGEWADTRVYEIKADVNGSSRTIVSERLDVIELGLSKNVATELDTSDPGVLSGFISYGKRAYKAKNYSLTIWGHGTGWRSGESSAIDSIVPMKAVAVDETSEKNMTIAKLAGAISGAQLKVLGFDTCFGGLLEVAYEVRNSSQFLVASSGPIQETGWNYQSVFNACSASMTSEQFSQHIVDSFKTDYSSIENATISIYNLEFVTDLQSCFNNWCGKMAVKIDAKDKRDAILSDLYNPSQVTSFYFPGTKSDYYINIQNLRNVLDNRLGIDQTSNELSDKLGKCIMRTWSKKNDETQKNIGVFVSGIENLSVPITPHSISYTKGSGSVTSSFVNDTYWWVPNSDLGYASIINKLFYAVYE